MPSSTDKKNELNESHMKFDEYDYNLEEELSSIDEKMELDKITNVKETNTKIIVLGEKDDNNQQLEMLYQNFINANRLSKKKQIAWAFFKRGTQKTDINSHWYYCTLCFKKEPLFSKSRGIYNYDPQNSTSTIRNHCQHQHSYMLHSFTNYFEKQRAKEKMSDEQSPKKLKGSCSTASIDTQKSFMTKWIHSKKKYEMNSKEQLSFEEDIIALSAQAYTPLSLVENESFRTLILNRDPRLHMVSRTRLSRTLIPSKAADTATNVLELLNRVPAVAISFDLWMTRKSEEIFSLDGHFIIGAIKSHAHLGMPWSKGGTDGQSLSIAVKSCVDKFGLQNKVLCYTSDGGGNLKTCKDNLDKVVTNGAIFNPSLPIFEQDCLAHALSGACKKAILNVKVDTLSIEKTRVKLQKCITWTKKSKRLQLLEGITRDLSSSASKTFNTGENKIRLFNTCISPPY